jgi:monothiol glutaredoxin
MTLPGPPARAVLPATRIDPAVRERVAGHHRALIDEVERAVATHPVVVVGMAQNPFPRRIRRALDAAGVAHHDIDHGSYFSGWRPRTALKMWTGWPTFPMVFVQGVLVGGAEDALALLRSGELARRLSTPRLEA